MKRDSWDEMRSEVENNLWHLTSLSTVSLSLSDHITELWGLDM